VAVGQGDAEGVGEQADRQQVVVWDGEGVSMVCGGRVADTGEPEGGDFA
jgi:hypothetical protein